MPNKMSPLKTGIERFPAVRLVKERDYPNKMNPLKTGIESRVVRFEFERFQI